MRHEIHARKSQRSRDEDTTIFHAGTVVTFIFRRIDRVILRAIYIRGTGRRALALPRELHHGDGDGDARSATSGRIDPL